jgi:hypothetical protein
MGVRYGKDIIGRKENEGERQYLSDRAEPEILNEKETDIKTEDTNKRLREKTKRLLKERKKRNSRPERTKWGRKYGRKNKMKGITGE